MHEGNFTRQIVESILDALKSHPGARPERVSVKVGETYHLEPESVMTHYKLLTQGTALENTDLNLKEVLMTAACGACHWTGRVEDHHLPLCGECGSGNIVVLTGREIEVEPFEIEKS